LLAAAIIAEVMGTLAVKASEGFTRVIPCFVVAAGYVLLVETGR
jgi:small multidrug resistance pump